jgi:hypothetical protein
LDVVAFFIPPDAAFSAQVAANSPVLTDRNAVKAQYRWDHFFVNMAYNPIATVELTRYWISLFSHRRDGIWKEMLRVELNTAGDDIAAGDYLRGLA